LALLAEPTVEAAAAKVGVAYSTLKEWLRDPEFQADYAAARRELLERGVARLLATVGKAVEALERNLTCGTPAAEIRAALAVLTHAMRGTEMLNPELRNANHDERALTLRAISDPAAADLACQLLDRLAGRQDQPGRPGVACDRGPMAGGPPPQSAQPQAS
jgi:hypothetical protein